MGMTPEIRRLLINLSRAIDIIDRNLLYPKGQRPLGWRELLETREELEAALLALPAPKESPEIRRLLDDWRRIADGLDDGSGVTASALYAIHYRARADELEALLPTDLPPTEAPFVERRESCRCSLSGHKPGCMFATALPPPVEPRRHRFDCPECGKGVAVDEDGCCRTCGHEATPVHAPPAEPPPQGEPKVITCSHCDGLGVMRAPPAPHDEDQS
jgi:hypothetical protein